MYGTVMVRVLASGLGAQCRVRRKDLVVTLSVQGSTHNGVVATAHDAVDERWLVLDGRPAPGAHHVSTLDGGNGHRYVGDGRLRTGIVAVAAWEADADRAAAADHRAVGSVRGCRRRGRCGRN